MSFTRYATKPVSTFNAAPTCYTENAGKNDKTVSRILNKINYNIIGEIIIVIRDFFFFF